MLLTILGAAVDILNALFVAVGEVRNRWLGLAEDFARWGVISMRVSVALDEIVTVGETEMA